MSADWGLGGAVIFIIGVVFIFGALILWMDQRSIQRHARLQRDAQGVHPLFERELDEREQPGDDRLNDEDADGQPRQPRRLATAPHDRFPFLDVPPAFEDPMVPVPAHLRTEMEEDDLELEDSAARRTSSRNPHRDN